MGRSAPLLARALEENAGFVRALARGLVRDAQAADDLVQDAWIVALEHPPQHLGNVRAWLGTVVERLAGRKRLAASRRITRESATARGEAHRGGIEEVEWEDTLRRLSTAVLSLEEPERSTILLRYYEGLSAPAIGVRMGVPASTVRDRLQRALTRLRLILDQKSGGDREAWVRGLIPFTGVGKVSSVASGGGLAACGGATVMGTTAKVTVGLIATACIGAAGWQVLELPGAPEQLAAAPDSAAVELHADPLSLQSDPNNFADSNEARREVPGGTVEQSLSTSDEGIEEEAVPKHVELGFLSFPNLGAEDFAAKYDAVDPSTLHAMLEPLNSMMDKEVRRVADLRFEAGHFVEHAPSSIPLEQMSIEDMEKASWFDKPQGLGRVWPVCRGGPQRDGTNQIVYLTEVENPEVFAMQDEYFYVFRLWIARDKAITESLTNGK